MKGNRNQMVLLAGEWRELRAAPDWFTAVNPTSGQALAEHYPVCGWADLERAVQAGCIAVEELRKARPEQIPEFLDTYANLIEADADCLAATAAEETGLPRAPRLRDVEVACAVAQLRRAAAAARDRSWRRAVIDTAADMRSMYEPLGGPVVVIGPANYPLARNAVAGADFAAAIAAGNPVIAKGHRGHPGTTRLLAAHAHDALRRARLPEAMVQMVYDVQPQDGLGLVAHRAVGAVAFTGRVRTGMMLKAAADAAAVPIHLQMGSVNPVFVLPGAVYERAAAVADDLAAAVLADAGQLCTKPGVIVLLFNHLSEKLVNLLRDRLEAAPPPVLMSDAVAEQLGAAIRVVESAGALRVTGGSKLAGVGCQFEPTLLRVAGAAFLERPQALQAELFGPAALVVLAADERQLVQIAGALGGSLAGSVFTSRGVADDALYAKLVPALRPAVGRFLNDRVPNEEAPSPALVHGGPFPAGAPLGAAAGEPFALQRFAVLRCYDRVRKDRLPPELRDRNPTGSMWRLIDGEWTQRDV